MTDLQMLIKQTSNPSILKMQQRLHDEVVQLVKIVEQKERDWLTISQETDEVIAALKSDNETMKAALIEVIKVLESDDPAISDTVWVSTGHPETLRDHCHHAVYGYLYEGEERA